MPGVRLSVVIVTFDGEAAVHRALGDVVAQLGEDDELIVVDNASSDGTRAAVAEIAPGARLLASDANLGFGAAANRGARAATGDLVVILNQDARPAPGWAQGIRRPLERGYGWDAWMALVTTHEGERVNTSGGVVHFTGLAWAGEAGRPAPGSLHAPRDVAFASGACLAVPAEAWERLGGFCESYFLYHEDVELSLRVALAGGRVGAEPAARVDHDYEFVKGAAKWHLLERNRWATLLRVYPGPLLVLLAPALAAAELAIWAAALRGGWAAGKARASADVLRALPRLLRERREVQRTRAIGAGRFAALLSAELDSPFLGGPVRRRPVALGLRAYWLVVRLALGALRS